LNKYELQTSSPFCAVETKLHHRPIATSQRSISVKLHSINDPRDTLDCLKASALLSVTIFM